MAASSSVDWLECGFVVALLLACAIALAPNNVNPDLWGHVQYAEDALADGTIHTTATHTYTAVGHRWINHENLSEFALAFAYRTLGPQGMLIAKCLLGVGVMILMLLSAKRHGVGLPVACAYMLLVATALTAFWAMRPQLASYVLLALMIAVLDRAFARWQDERRVAIAWLLLLPPLFVVWTNSHGAFVAGLALLIAYLGCRSIEAIVAERRAAAPTVVMFAIVAIVATAATLLNPYGPDLLLWLAESLRRPRPEITEWAAPGPSDPFFWPFVLLVVISIAAWCLTEKRRDWTQGILLALCVWQAAMHSRHIALLAVLAGFWMPVHVQSAFVRLRRGAMQQDTNGQPGNAPRAVVVGLCFALVLLVGKLYLRLSDFPVERNNYPVDALQFMADHRMEGRAVVAFNWAQYAIAALEPDVKVAFDGRFRTCYPQEVIDMHFDFLLGDRPGKRFRGADSGPYDPTKILHVGQPDLVLSDRRFSHATRTMQAQDDFVLLYQDALAEIWGRRDGYDDPNSPKYLSPDERRIDDNELAGSVTWPALPVHSRGGRLAQHPSHDQTFSATNTP